MFLITSFFCPGDNFIVARLLYYQSSTLSFFQTTRAYFSEDTPIAVVMMIRNFTFIIDVFIYQAICYKFIFVLSQWFGQFVSLPVYTPFENIGFKWTYCCMYHTSTKCKIIWKIWQSKYVAVVLYFWLQLSQHFCCTLVIK